MASRVGEGTGRPKTRWTIWGAPRSQPLRSPPARCATMSTTNSKELICVTVCKQGQPRVRRDLGVHQLADHSPPQAGAARRRCVLASPNLPRFGRLTASARCAQGRRARMTPWRSSPRPLRRATSRMGRRAARAPSCRYPRTWPSTRSLPSCSRRWAPARPRSRRRRIHFNSLASTSRTGTSGPAGCAPAAAPSCPPHHCRA